MATRTTVGNHQHHMALPVGAMRSELHGGGASSGQSRNRNVIPPGECGFRGCNADRMGGEWQQGGSYMCLIHMKMLLPTRALWDKKSPPATAYANRFGLNRDKELAQIKYEEGRERNAA